MRFFLPQRRGGAEGFLIAVIMVTWCLVLEYPVTWAIASNAPLCWPTIPPLGENPLLLCVSAPLRFILDRPDYEHRSICAHQRITEHIQLRGAIATRQSPTDCASVKRLLRFARNDWSFASLRGTKHEFFMAKTHAQSAAPEGQHRDVIFNLLQGDASAQKIAALPLAMTRFLRVFLLK